MARKRIFVKVSGDEFLSDAFLKWLNALDDNSPWIVICVGGGTQINAEFERLGFPVRKHGPLGREMNTFEERQSQRDVLERNQALLQDALSEKNISAVVEMPILTIGAVICPVNGDQMVRTVYLGYDELYVVTTATRAEKKHRMFAELPKVRVMYEDGDVMRQYIPS